MKSIRISKLFSKDRTFVKGGLFALFSFINSGIGFVLLIILARFIEPNEYGHLSIFNTVVTFLGPIIGLSTAGYLGISFFQNDEVYFKKDFTAVFIIHVVTMVLFIIILLFGGRIIGNMLVLPMYMVYVAIISVFFQGLFSIYLNYLRMQEKIINYGYYSCGFALANFALTLFLVIFCHQSWTGRVHSQVICSLIFGICVLFIFYKKDFFQLHYSKEKYKKIILWALPLIPNMAIVWLTNGVDQYIIKYHYSLYEVGIFSLALNLNGVITMIGGAFNATNSVTLFKILSNKTINDKINLLKKREKGFIIIYFVATLSVVLILSILIPIFLPKYKPSIPYFFILSVFGFLQCIYWLYCNYFFYFKQNKKLMYILFSTAILHLLLSLLLTRFSLYLTAIVYPLGQIFVVFFVVKGAIRLRNNTS